MTDHARARRLADRIKVVTAEMVERGIKDPRLGFVTLTDVRVTPDLREAKVFYTVLGDATARKDSDAALQSATGVLRAEIGKQCRLRFIPTLEFIADEVPESAAALEELLAATRAADAEKARLAADAVPAGDPDPYRKPRDVDEEQ